MQGWAATIQAWWHEAPAGHWLGGGFWLALGRLREFLAGPLTGLHTRFYWVFLAEAVVLLAVVHVWQGGAARDVWRRIVPGRVLLHRSSLVDCQINLANALIGPALKIFWRFSAPAVLAADMLHGFSHMFGGLAAPLHWHASLPALLVVTVLVAVGDDLGYYVFHRTAHTVPWLWEFHKIHHSAEVLTPLVAGRVHPVEMVLSEPVRAVFAAVFLAPALYCFGGDVPLVTVGGISVVALLFGALGNQLLHSEVAISFGPRLDRWLVSPAVHQIHHSVAPRHHNRNMGGLLTVWDRVFGTLYLPRAGEALRYGLGEAEAGVHRHVLAAYARPFWDIGAGLARRVAPRLVPRRGAVRDGAGGL